MALLWTFAVFVFVLFLVVKSSGYFVEFAARIARRFGVSEFVIGLTLIAIGTSLPELMNSIVSSLKGVNELSLGNIIGANMANIGLSVGLSVLIGSVAIKPRLYRNELYLLLAVTASFILICLDGELSSIEGVLLCVAFFVYIAYLTRLYGVLARFVQPVELDYFVEYLSKAVHVPTRKSLEKQYKGLVRQWRRGLFLDIGGLVLSGVVLLFAADVFVDKAVEIAALLGVTNAAVGATIVALGTTMPELSVSIASVRKGYHQMLIGNIIGSNVINVLLIIGLAGAIHPVAVSATLLYLLGVLAVATVVFAYVLSREWVVPKAFGVLLLGLYAAFLVFVWLL